MRVLHGTGDHRQRGPRGGRLSAGAHRFAGPPVLTDTGAVSTPGATQDLDARPRPCRRRFDLLVVCTANLCRSPAMEAQLRAVLDTGPGSWDVHSAGTRARAGLPAHPDTVAVLAERGLTLPADWRSRALTAADVDTADLVLTATRGHRGAVVALHPTAAGRVFTLHQFTRLLGAAGGLRPGPGDRHPGEMLLHTAQAGRGLGAPPADPRGDDLPDPIGRPRSAFEQMAATIDAQTAAISRSLALVR